MRRPQPLFHWDGSRMAQYTRRFSSKLQFYMLRQYLLPLFCCLAGFCVLFLVMDIFDDLVDFLDAHTAAREAALYFLARQPVNLVHVLPLSVLLAASYTLNNLSRHHEVTALRAAGISIIQSCLPIWLTGLLLTGLLFWLNEEIGPRFTAVAEAMQERLTGDETAASGQRSLLAYRNARSRRDWFFEHFNRQGEQAGVSIKQFAGNSSQLDWELRAARARYSPADGWVFYDVKRWEYEPGDPLPVLEQPFDEWREAGLNETPADIFSSLRPVEELSAFEMIRVLERNPTLPPGTRRIFRATIWYRFTFPLSCIVASLFGVGMALGRERASALRGFALAVGLMIFYYLISQGTVLMAKYGWLPPLLGGWLPPLGFIAYGSWQVWEKR